jgi:hypothetical protein
MISENGANEKLALKKIGSERHFEIQSSRCSETLKASLGLKIDITFSESKGSIPRAFLFLGS